MHMHDAIKKFVGTRSSAPGEGENVLNVVPYGHIKSLHVGQGRAATIFDPNEDVCWLLAYSPTHAEGEERDAYRHFERLHGRGELRPTANDYAALTVVTSASLMDELRSISETLMEEAVERQGEETCRSFTLDDGKDASITVAIEVIVELDDTAEQGWISFVLPYDAQIGQAQLLELVADLIPPHVDEDTIEFAADVRGRVVAHNEVAFTWSAYSDNR